MKRSNFLHCVHGVHPYILNIQSVLADRLIYSYALRAHVSSKKRTRTECQQALVDLRERLGLTQRKLALALDVTVVSVCRWETSRPPSGTVLAKLADFARSSGQVDLAELFNRCLWEGMQVTTYAWRPIPSLTASLALQELFDSTDPLIVKERRRLVSQLVKVHGLLIRKAVAELDRAPSAAQAKRVLELQERQEQLLQEIKTEEIKS